MMRSSPPIGIVSTRFTIILLIYFIDLVIIAFLFLSFANSVQIRKNYNRDKSWRTIVHKNETK